MKICLYFTSDLMFSSRVKPTAAEAGYEIRFPGKSFDSVDASIDLVIIDLEYLAESELKELMEMIGRCESAAPLSVAYGPHVKTALLDTAKKAGVEQVWSRGQFNKSFASLFDR